MEFGKRLKELRSQNRLTQQDMAGRLHMEQSTYSRYENGKIVATSDIIRRICEEFKISADWLLQIESSDQDNESVESNFKHVNQFVMPKDLLENMIEQQKRLKIILANLEKKI